MLSIDSLSLFYFSYTIYPQFQNFQNPKSLIPPISHHLSIIENNSHSIEHLSIQIIRGGASPHRTYEEGHRNIGPWRRQKKFKRDSSFTQHRPSKSRIAATLRNSSNSFKNLFIMKLLPGVKRKSERVAKNKLGVGFSNNPDSALDLTEDEDVPVIQNIQVNVPVVQNIQLNIGAENEEEQDEESEESEDTSSSEFSETESETEQANNLRRKTITHFIEQHFNKQSVKELRSRDGEKKRKRKDVNTMKSNRNPKSIKISITCPKSKVKTYSSIRTRTSPKALSSTIQSLKNDQKIDLEEIGFGSFLDFNIESIPGKLGFFIVDCFDEKKIQLQTSSGFVNVTAEIVQEILGIPYGGVDLLSLKESDEKHPVYALWWDQFNRSERISVGRIATQIKKSNDSGILFKLNFIFLFVTTMCEAQKSGFGYPSVIKRLVNDIDISSVDWCKHLVYSLVVTKKSWKKNDIGKYFNGPLTFLILLYVNRFKSATIEVLRSRPVLKIWSSEMLKDRETDEIENGGFGKYGLESDIHGNKAIVVNDAVNDKEKMVKHLRNKFSRYVEYKTELEALIAENIDNEDVVRIKDMYLELARNVPDFGSSSKGKEKEKESPVTPNDDSFVIRVRTTNALPVSFISPREEDVIDWDVENQKRESRTKKFNDGIPSFSLGLTQEEEVNDEPVIEKNVDAANMEAIPSGLDANIQSEMEATNKENIDAHVHENIVSKIPEVIRSIPEDEEMHKESLDVFQLMKLGILLTPTDIEDDDVLIDRATLGKRVVKKSAALCSPYTQKEVDMKHKVSRIEAKVSNRLFLLDGEPSDQIFVTKSGTFIFRAYMESLIPESWITTEVIDCWTIVLNSEEPYISNDSSFRLFLPVSFVSSKMLESTYSDEVNIRVLSNAFSARLKLLKIKDVLKVKIVFFPKSKVKTYSSIRTRTSPKALSSTIQSLKNDQKIALEEIGFGSFLDFNIESIPGKLGFFVVDCFDEKKIQLQTSSGFVNVTAEIVQEILGIPYGGVDLLSLKESDEKHPVYALWWDQFNRSERISVGRIATQIKKSNDSGILFKLNFIFLFVTTMCEAQKSGFGYPSVIKRLVNDIDISSVDWCKHLVYSLVVTKKSWKKNDIGKYFNGPLTFLILLYVNRFKSATIEVLRSRPVLKIWSSEMLKDRETDEIENGGFGKYGLESDIHGNKAIVVNDAVNDKEKMVKHLRNKFSRYVEYKTELEALIAENIDNEDVVRIKDMYLELARNVPDFGSSSKGKEKEKESPVTPNDDSFVIRVRTTNALPVSFISPREEDVIDWDVENQKRESRTKKFNDGIPSFSLGLTQEEEVNDEPVIEKNVDAANMEAIPSGLDANIQSEMEATNKENIDAHVHENIVSKIPEVIRSIPEDEEMHKESLDVFQLMKLGILLTPTDIEDDDVLIDRATLGKRVVKKSAALCSPYTQKEVDMKHKVSRIEAKVSNRLFLLDGEPSYQIFVTKSGTFIFRAYMESLIPESWITTEVIDCWTIVLNSEEPYISNDSSFRLFLPVSFVSSKMLESTYSDEVNIRVLSNAFSARLKLLKIKDVLKVKIVFFPIHSHGHYYLIVVDLKKGSFFIIDNVKRFSKPSEIYGEVPKKIHKLFVGVLKSLNHPIAHHVVFDDSKIPELKWQTSYNGNDCGVFLMRHMESFKGTSLARWTCGIVKESMEQKRQLNRLRRKYATKILLSDLNLKKDEVFKEAEIFDQKSFDSKTLALIDSFSRRKERMNLL